MDPRYPIGRFEPKPSPTQADLRKWVSEIANLPANLRAAVAQLPEGGLDRPYREGGWTGRQVVHHLADSHINAYVRTRFALAEEIPVIMPYNEAVWAEFEDAARGPVDASLALLGALHQRWVMLFESLTREQWRRRFRHPELGESDLLRQAAMYAWHGRHHLAHLALIR